MPRFIAAFEFDARDMSMAHDITEEMATAHNVSVANLFRVEPDNTDADIALRWLPEEARIGRDSEGQIVLYTGVYSESA